MGEETDYVRGKNAVYGFALGEAAGYPYRGKNRDEMRAVPFKAITKEIRWYDATSFLLATFDGLKNGADYVGIMNRYKAYRDEGTYAQKDSGRYLSETVSASLEKYDHGVDPVLCGGTDPKTWKNGSLLRMLPAALYIYFNKDVDYIDSDGCYQFIENLSSLTHRAVICHIACAIYVNIALFLLEEKQQEPRDIVKLAADKVLDHYRTVDTAKEYIGYYVTLSDPNFSDTPEDEISSGSSVVHTLHASLWCFLNSHSYTECVARAINLGGDTSATAACAGALAVLVGNHAGNDGKDADEESDTSPDTSSKSFFDEDLNWLPLLEEHDAIERYLQRD